MEGAAGVAAARGAPLPIASSQPSRKEWRIVSEHSGRNAGNEDLERSKLAQSDERTIYEQGREPADVDFCSITIDGNPDGDILQQRLHNIARQREELQHMEIELRAQIIARAEIMEMQNNFDAHIKDQANANGKLQDKLCEMEQALHELGRKMEEKERELQSIKLEKEAAWAKEDLLREQSKELQTFRRERDNSEAERAQHLKQIHDLQEHIQEKERQFLELQEQHRVAQETIIFKDEQLREAQAWMTRAQEMDVLQSTTNHSLQAELLERTEQYNQLWVGYQQQFAEMERIHLHTIQQLQLELADARERNGAFPDESHISQAVPKDSSQFGQSNGSQMAVSGSSKQDANSGVLSNGNAESVSSGNSSNQVDHVHGIPIAPSSLLGMPTPTYLPPRQVTTLHPFLMHRQGVHHSVPSHVAQSHIGHFHSLPASSSHQPWPNQQAMSEASPTHHEYPSSQNELNMLGSDAIYNYDVSVNGQAIGSEYLDGHVSQEMGPNSVIKSSAEVFEPADKQRLVSPHPQQSLQHISSQFDNSLRLNPLPGNESKEKGINSLANHELEAQGTEQASSAASEPSMTEQDSSTASEPPSEAPNNLLSLGETGMNTNGVVPLEVFTSLENNFHATGRTPEVPLLDERSLLACIVRTIPPGSGGKIRISSTLPNRLGKMLAPLHWHDYKKYGKLDDFVASHPELFVIEGDYIQLREGAQEIIAATTAVAKVAAAAKTISSPYSSLLPSVAVTPMAQSHRLKRTPSIDSTMTSNTSQLLPMQNQHPNGVYLNAGGISNVKILSKPKDPQVLNGPESRLGQSSGLAATGNGVNPERLGLFSSPSKGQANGRPSTNSAGKLKARTVGGATTSRR